MIVHHIATILLMSMSYTANMIRVGTLVLVVHDSVDYILEVIQLMERLKWHRAVLPADTGTVLFSLQTFALIEHFVFTYCYTAESINQSLTSLRSLLLLYLTQLPEIVLFVYCVISVWQVGEILQIQPVL